MFRMSKASIIRSSICTEQVGRYNVRVVVGSSYVVARLRLQEQQNKNVQDQRSVMVRQNVQIRTTTYDEPTTTRTLYLSTCSVHIGLLMMDAFDVQNM